MQPPAGDVVSGDVREPSRGESKVVDPIQSLDQEQQALITKELLRQTPEYQVAWELELWKKQELSRFQARLKREESRLRSRLETAFEQQESSRQAQFEQRLQAHEELERRLQIRLSQVKKREDRLKDIEKELRRRQNELEADFKRKVEQSNQAIRLAREECAHKVNLMQLTVNESEDRLHASKARCEELDHTMIRLRDDCSKLTHRLRSRPVRPDPVPTKPNPPRSGQKRPRLGPTEAEWKERLRLVEDKNLSEIEAREETHKAELSTLAQRHATRVSRLVRRVVELKANLKVARAELRAERARRRSSERVKRRRTDVESALRMRSGGSGKKGRTIVIPARALQSVLAGKSVVPGISGSSDPRRTFMEEQDVSTASPSRRQSQVDYPEQTAEALDDLRKQLDMLRHDVKVGVQAEITRLNENGVDRRRVRSRKPSRHLPPGEDEPELEVVPTNSSNAELVRSFEDRDDPLLGSPEQKRIRPEDPQDEAPSSSDRRGDFVDHDHELAMFPPIVEIVRTDRTDDPTQIQIRALIENKARLLASGNYGDDDPLIQRLDGKLANLTK